MLDRKSVEKNQWMLDPDIESYDKAQNVQKVGHKTNLNLLNATKAEKGKFVS